jgi:hypothetical protein
VGKKLWKEALSVSVLQLESWVNVSMISIKSRLGMALCKRVCYCFPDIFCAEAGGHREDLGREGDS